MNALIIDDETKARSLLNSILYETNCMDQLFEADNLIDGVKILKGNSIDVLFLDIEMPQHSGLQLFDFIAVEDVKFEIVFTTAYSEYAIKAFEFSAIDYLLKPLRPSRVKEALEKVKKNKEQNQLHLRLQELKTVLTSDKFSKLALPVEDGVLFVRFDDIYFLEADGMYTTFHFTNGKKNVISKPMKYFVGLLEAKDFFYKPHRSYLVNLKYLQKLVKRDGTYIEMENGIRIPVSKEKKDELWSIISE